VTTPTSPDRLASVVPSGIVYALQFAAVGAWSAYAIVYFQALGVAIGVIGVLIAIPSVVAIFAAPAWGLAADRLGDMRAPYLVAALWAAAASLVLALGPTMPWLVVVVIAVAIGSAGTTPLLDARTVQRLWPRRERFGQARAWGSLAFMAATVAVGVIIPLTGLPAIFIVYAVTMAGAGIAAMALLGREDRGLRIGGIGPLAAVGLLRKPGLGLFFAGSVVVWISAVGSMALFSLRVVELGGDTTLVGIGWAVNAMFEIPLMLAFPRLARRVRVEWLIVIGACAFAVRCALWGAVGSAVPFMVVTALGGFGYALVLVGTTTYVASRVSSGLQATAQALFSSTAFASGAIVGSILAGQIAAAGGLGAVYPVAAVGSVLGAGLIWAAIVRPGRADPAAGTLGRAAASLAADQST
jgi:PPP family 3-phenylpropionic acid transporter